jgi:hypothetical protein
VAYVGRVPRRLLSFVFATVAVACQAAAPRGARTTPAPQVASPPPAKTASATASACRAEPSTVYGEEPVNFRIEAPRAAELPVTLTDELGRPVSKSTAAAPGTFSPLALASGDYTLRVGPTQVACTVTVNRELSRATQPAR